MASPPTESQSHRKILWNERTKTSVLYISSVSVAFVFAILALGYPDRMVSLITNPVIVLGAIILAGPAAVIRWSAARGKLQKETFYPSEDPIINSLLLSLKYRARRLHFQAHLVLTLILATVGAGIYVFATAEQLSRTPITTLTEELGHTRGLVVDSVTRRIENQTTLEAINSLRQAIDNVEKTVKDRANDFTSTFVISTLSTRIGIILMILFLVQVLVTMYRYNTRLAAHLEGRAVALQLSSLQQNQQWNIAELVNLFAADGVDFGKLPPTAVQSFADILKHSAEAVSKRTTP